MNAIRESARVADGIRVIFDGPGNRRLAAAHARQYTYVHGVHGRRRVARLEFAYRAGSILAGRTTTVIAYRVIPL